MKKLLVILLVFVSWMFSSCAYEYRYGDLGGYHYGQYNHFNGKYRGAHHRYRWEGPRGHQYRAHYHYTR